MMKRILTALMLGLAACLSVQAAPFVPSQAPLFLKKKEAPSVLLAMGKDHRLFYEAYDDKSDLDGDGYLDVRYRPQDIGSLKGINYYGYFDSFKCYTYNNDPTVANKRFVPVRLTTNKKCNQGGATGEWSGDFLNYLTTSRVDALRKVFYGGYRAKDTTTETWLQRSYIPQDAHSWGKEYTSTTTDGYNISDYAPLAEPATGTRHLFANTTLLCSAHSSLGTQSANDPACSSTPSLKDQPLLRVLSNSTYRIWEWVSIERPVAGYKCQDGSWGPNCVQAGGWRPVPSTMLQDVTYKVYGLGYQTAINSAAAFDTAIQGKSVVGSGSVSLIDGIADDTVGNLSSRANTYVTVFIGKIVVSETGSYTFGVKGDDAVEVKIGTNTNPNLNPVVASHYGQHGENPTYVSGSSITLTAGVPYVIQYRHHENTGNASWRFGFTRPNLPNPVMASYVVRNEACKSATLVGQERCEKYGANYKPAGMLQKYGANDQMYFGLITGSYDNNLKGGVLRRNIGSIWDEVDSSTGQFIATTNGIVSTLNKLSIFGFRRNDYAYANCDDNQKTDSPANGRCNDWGNPIGEIMWEGLRYLAGKGSKTPQYNTSPLAYPQAVLNTSAENGQLLAAYGTSIDSTLGLPAPSWSKPYIDAMVPTSIGATTKKIIPWCSQPFMLTVSDVSSSFDSDDLPGAYWSSGVSSDVGTFDAASLGQTLWTQEFGSNSKNVFIGQVGSLFDFLPSAKTASSFGNIRGLAPNDPTRQGSYYAASVANFGKTNKLKALNSALPNKAGNDSGVDFFSVALASPLPKMEIPIGNTKVTFVPLGKTVAGYFGDKPYKPTNQIVDFYVADIANVLGARTDANVNGGRPYYQFRINYEDVENGNDHDMDVITLYTLSVTADNKLNVKVNVEYEGGTAVQKMGYVISGTTADGVKLVVCDELNTDTSSFQERCDLGLSSDLTFTPSSSVAASTLNDPLWYAAKYGSFTDINKDGVWNSADLGDVSSWDADGDGVPDNYFLVTNAAKLEAQLEKAFSKINQKTGSISSLTSNKNKVLEGALAFQAVYEPDGWSGSVRAFTINTTTGDFSAAPIWDAGSKLTARTSRRVVTVNPDLSTAQKGIEFDSTSITSVTAPTLYPRLNALTTCDTAGECTLGSADGLADQRINYLRGSSALEDNAYISSDDLQPFRGRTNSKGVRSVMGDVIYSDPLYVGKATYGRDTSDLFEDFEDLSLARKPAVYVGTNAGMLHAFDASLTAGSPDTRGEELFSYIPLGAYKKIGYLANKTYSHQFMIDGPLKAFDVLFSTGPEYKTILVSGMGAGGKGYFVLDITCAGKAKTSATTCAANTNVTAANLVVWDRTGATWGASDGYTAAEQANLGYSYSIPQVTQVKCSTAGCNVNGVTNVLVFGNGYGSTSGKPVLWIVNLETGAVIKTIEAGSGNPSLYQSENGLSSPVLRDENNDGVVDYAYAGDLKGNLWRFDLRGNNSANWGVKLGNGTALPLISVGKPITVRPTIFLHPVKGYIINFATGKFMEDSDKADSSILQSIYGVWDPMVSGQGSMSVARLVTQEEVVLPGYDNYFSTTSNPVTYKLNTQGTALDYSGTSPSNDGWIYNLKTNERVVSNPYSGSNRLLLNSITPNLLMCEPGGRTSEYCFTPVQGAACLGPLYVNSSAPVIINGVPYYPTGQRDLGVGLAGNPLVLGNNDKANSYSGGTEGGDINNNLKYDPNLQGRVSWRELFQ